MIPILSFKFLATVGLSVLVLWWVLVGIEYVIPPQSKFNYVVIIATTAILFFGYYLIWWVI